MHGAARLCVRYQQVGNAVSPCVASASGRCLALAATGAVPATLDCAVVPVPDPALVQCQKESARLGLNSYQEQQALRQTAAAASLHSSSRQLIQPMEPVEEEEDHQQTADKDNVGLAVALKQRFLAEEEQHHPNEADTAAASLPCDSSNQQVMAEEEHSQEDAGMPASQVSGASLQHQQAQEEEQALSALHASVHFHGPAELLAAEEEGSEVHALHSSVQLQGAAEPGNTNAEQVAADLPHEACPEAEEQDLPTDGLLHLSLQTASELTNTDVSAVEQQQ